MAGGLGTRMRSAVPKHLHPILGRRMVDWVIAAARAIGADPLVVVASPAGRDERVRRGVDGRRPGAAARHRRRRARRAGGARTARGDVLVLSGDTPLADRRAARATRRHAHRERRRGHDPRRRAARPARLRPHRARRRRLGRCASSRNATRPTDERAIREINSSIYVFRADKLWPALEQLEPKNAQGELYLTDTIEILVAAGEKVAAHVAPEHRRGRGREHARRARRGRRRPARPDQRARTCSPASRSSTRRRPGSSRRRRARARRRRPAVHRPPRRDAGRGRRRDRRAHGGHRRRHRDRRVVGPFCYLRPGTVLGAARRRGHSWRSRTRRSASARRCPISRTSATPTSARTRTSARARSPPTSPTTPAGPRAARRSAATSGPAVHNAFVAPVDDRRRCMDRQRERSSRTTSRPESLAGFPPRQVNKGGIVQGQRGKRDD